MRKTTRVDERETYDDAYYANHAKYYDRGLSGFKQFIISHFVFDSLVDVGCGTGAFSAILQDEKRVVGVDFSVGSETSSRLRRENFILADLTKPLHDIGKFDIALSLEVWEHMPTASEKQYLDNLCSLAEHHLIVSCAMPGQIGRHHYNPHIPEEVLNIISARGFEIDFAATYNFSKIPLLAAFYRKNTFVFVKSEHTQSSKCVQCRADIALGACYCNSDCHAMKAESMRNVKAPFKTSVEEHMLKRSRGLLW